MNDIHSYLRNGPSFSYLPGKVTYHCQPIPGEDPLFMVTYTSIEGEVKEVVTDHGNSFTCHEFPSFLYFTDEE